MVTKVAMIAYTETHSPKQPLQHITTMIMSEHIQWMFVLISSVQTLTRMTPPRKNLTGMGRILDRLALDVCV